MNIDEKIRNAALNLGDIFGAEVEADTPVFVLSGRMVAVDEDTAEDAGGAIRQMPFGTYARLFYKKFGRVPEMEYVTDGVAYAD